MLIQKSIRIVLPFSFFVFVFVCLILFRMSMVSLHAICVIKKQGKSTTFSVL